MKRLVVVLSTILVLCSLNYGQNYVVGLQLSQKENITVLRIQTETEPELYNLNSVPELPGVTIFLKNCEIKLDKRTFTELPDAIPFKEIQVEQYKKEPEPMVKITLLALQPISYYVSSGEPNAQVVELLTPNVPPFTPWSYAPGEEKVTEQEPTEEQQEGETEPATEEPTEEEKAETLDDTEKTEAKAEKKDEHSKQATISALYINGFMLNYKEDTTIFNMMFNKATDLDVNDSIKPPRLIIDVPGASINLSEQELGTLPNSNVMEIDLKNKVRDDKKFARIILFLAERVEDYVTSKDETGLTIKIPAKNYPPFPTWAKMKAGGLTDQSLTKVGEDTTASSDDAGEKGDETDDGLELGTQEIKGPFYNRLTITYKMYTYDSITGQPDTINPIANPFRIPHPYEQKEFGKPSVPKVEDLSLVGTVIKEGENIAILQNCEGYGYVLSVDDSVRNGKVVEVSKNSIKFNVTEFGWTRKVKLSLKQEDD